MEIQILALKIEKYNFEWDNLVVRSRLPFGNLINFSSKQVLFLFVEKVNEGDKLATVSEVVS